MDRVYFTLSLFSTVSFSQAQFGIKAGVNISNYGGDDGDGMDSRLVPLFGGFARFNLSDNMSFQPELLYSMKGAKGSGEVEGINVDVTEKLSYIDVPLMLKFYVSEGFNFQAGPQLSFLLSAEGEFKGGGVSVTEDYKEYMKSVDFGLNLGAGYEFDFGFGIDFRYNMGLTNIVDDGGGEIKNRAFQIGVSYAF
ncbi:porin family protein [Thermophagus sp. OGC60D27]|uniref:porin family protein n=1 Tax=Thermophagus sp. OGC60D27 TaxID=3458415 RepID=UPI0040378382